MHLRIHLRTESDDSAPAQEQRDVAVVVDEQKNYIKFNFSSRILHQKSNVFMIMRVRYLRVRLLQQEVTVTMADEYLRCSSEDTKC